MSYSFKFKAFKIVLLSFLALPGQAEIEIESSERLNGIKFQIMAKNTEVYKGFPKETHLGSFPDMAWFGDYDVAQCYTKPRDEASKMQCANGFVLKYKTTSELRLVDLGDVRTLQLLHEDIVSSDLPPVSKNQYVSILEQTFSLDHENQITRISERELDKDLAKMICRTFAYDGYYAPKMTSFHEELMICHPGHKLSDGIGEMVTSFNRYGSPVRE